MTVEHRRCNRCVMDTSVPDIRFDREGLCNYCTQFLLEKVTRPLADRAARSDALNRLVSDIRRQGSGRRYDCVIGVSGGVDSSWVLVQAVRMGLRPLAVHMDNGWNSELAQNNIANLVRGLGLDLDTHVIDWREYRGLMQAFFDADVVDVELLYDNAMFAVNYRQAAGIGVRHILGGMNHATEGMRLPVGWNWYKFDKRNIKGIARRFGGPSLRSFPAIGLIDRAWYQYVRGIHWSSILDLMDFSKQEALGVLQSEFGYKSYPYKHYESVFTRFYQGYILPRKFGIDKRLVHLSTLILNAQLTRDAALQLLAQIPYPSEAEMETDRRYFVKKMGWTDAQLNEYIGRPEKSHALYGSSYRILNVIRRRRAEDRR
jgi:N-acetyl sugar amidotransferase